MSVAGILILIIIAIVAFAYAGTEITAFIEDTASKLKQDARDNKIKAPEPKLGDTVCDVFLDVTLREKTSVGSVPILFTNTEGKSVVITTSKCHELTLFSLIPDTASLLEIIIPTSPIFDEKFEMDYVMVSSDGTEVVDRDYLGVEYEIPAFSNSFDYQEKLVYKNMIIGDWTLEMEPTNARWADHAVGQPYKQQVSVPP